MSRMDVIILKRNLGTASGWDGDPGECVWFYDYIPAKDVPFTACECFQYDEVSGNFNITNNVGTILKAFDVVKALANIPKL